MITSSYRPKYAKGQTAVELQAQADAERLAKETAQLAEVHPAKVSLPHFIQRNIAAEIAAGHCVATVGGLFHTVRYTVVDVIPGSTPRSQYTILLKDAPMDEKSMMSEDVQLTWHTTEDEPPKPPTIVGMTAEKSSDFNMANILQVIAAVAADNLMRNSIVKTAPDQYRIEIIDGLGNALSQPVFVRSSYAAVQKAGIWFHSYKFGQWLEVQSGSMGDGWGVKEFFSPARTWERNQRNSR